ncbi:MAG: hypothetical protein ACRCSL_16645 [Microbacterium sp.]
MKLLLVPISSVIVAQESSRLDNRIVAAAQRLIRVLGGWDVSRIPPITGFVTRDGFLLHDGHHRVAAAMEGIKEVPALNFAAMRRSDTPLSEGTAS